MAVTNELEKEKSTKRIEPPITARERTLPFDT